MSAKSIAAISRVGSADGRGVPAAVGFGAAVGAAEGSDDAVATACGEADGA